MERDRDASVDDVGLPSQLTDTSEAARPEQPKRIETPDFPYPAAVRRTAPPRNSTHSIAAAMKGCAPISVRSGNRDSGPTNPGSSSTCYIDPRILVRETTPSILDSCQSQRSTKPTDVGWRAQSAHPNQAYENLLRQSRSSRYSLSKSESQDGRRADSLGQRACEVYSCQGGADHW